MRSRIPTRSLAVGLAALGLAAAGAASASASEEGNHHKPHNGVNIHVTDNDNIINDSVSQFSVHGPFGSNFA
ncbi:hypothetical protein ACTWQF_07225 [Streptomyces sp. 8N114]|uniref:hypothetical protein n=1 Tax=Streptomyces sp. 8N114 TaxID=3457419 RepID=UPI003FD58FDE